MKTENKMEKLNTTNLWIVLNEETLNTMKGKGGKTAKFGTEAEANDKASEKLNIWIAINVHFKHKWIKH
tara:strand:- start:186 stop:392 length:207 start_codon:yes stop_codon:yes gene_type:complete